MILPDLNLLIYAYDERSSFYRDARIWWDGVLAGHQPVGMAWITLVGFIRIATRPTPSGAVMSIDEALEWVNTWLGQPHVRVLSPTERHLALPPQRRDCGQPYQ